ncbi:MAG: hypothetical protein HYU70_02030 [Bacteroidetes bacterium]|nr:hypothetical protein [Bacteroidota bacterium]
MTVPQEVMAFRNDRATDLLNVATVLRKEIAGNFDASPITKAVKQLKDPAYIPAVKNGPHDPNLWGYEIPGLILEIPINRHSNQGVTKVELTLEMKLVADYREWTTMNDPFAELCFRVALRGIGTTTFFSGFHIDRHDMTTTPTDPHPLYHFQYNVNPHNAKPFNYGSILHLDEPRIVHFPLDFVLGIGFLTSNFFPMAFDALIDNGTYANLYKKYQNCIWKPFSHSLANHWTYNSASITWKPTKLLCPYLI